MTTPKADISQHQGVWTYLEHRDRKLESVSLEILGKARELADKLRTPLTGILMGYDVRSLADEAVRYGADKVLLADSPLLQHYSTDGYTSVLANLVLERKPSILLIGGTHDGRDLAGRLAIRVQTGLIANVVRLDIEEDTGLLLGAVPGFGGRILAICKCERSRPQIATVRPGVFPLPHAGSSRNGDVEQVPVSLSEGEIRTKVLERFTRELQDISRAEYTVIAGSGTGGDLTLARQLAELLGGALGVTRPLADKGIVSRDYQIGSTGYAVRSKLTFVIGASGASHFTSGIGDAKIVVSINKDPEAQIFRYSDYCIVGDLFHVVPALIEALKKEVAVHA